MTTPTGVPEGNKVPIVLANGTRIGPVTIVCSTLLFLAMIACFVILALYGDPNSIYKFIGPVIPVLGTFATGLLLWVKAHTVQVSATQQAAQAAENAAKAEQTAQHVNDTVTQVGTQVADNAHQLNGELNGKIINAIFAAINDPQFRDAIRTAFAEPPQPVKKTAAKRTTRKKV